MNALFEVIEYENANDIAICDIIPPTRIAGLFDVCNKNNFENISRWLRYGYNNWVWYHTEHDYRIFIDQRFHTNAKQINNILNLVNEQERNVNIIQN
jgi:hypothetical protein